MIDLNKCVFGDKLRLRNGEIAIYARPNGRKGEFVHDIVQEWCIGDPTRTDNGFAFYEKSEFDVVEILGQGEQK